MTTNNQEALGKLIGLMRSIADTNEFGYSIVEDFIDEVENILKSTNTAISGQYMDS